ncbi:hypothetical protein AA0117_g1884 [Alternaria alternata]|uniref:Uncharacterized protein n=1 Tax=Alternaria alternata TaxID=5599 RepID=A0A4Q4NQB2_ALTAL|nr:hypothetical protein AA0117_g1884 [Alternaria alternata]
MSNLGVNLAVTKDGETYNKLQRPDGYLISTQPPPTSPPAASPTTYSGKRKCAQEEVPEVKRARIERNTAHSKRRPRVLDSYQEYGTRTVLPGLDGEEQLSDESTSEALAYLHSVRSEASAIPTLLVAPNNLNAGDVDSDDDEPHYTTPTHKQRVIYKEGTWIAVDREHDAAKWEEDPSVVDPQQGCNNMLLQRFQNLRNKLAEIRKHRQVSKPAKKSTNTLKAGKYQWSEIIESNFPNFEEVADMDESTLYVALQGCTLALGRSVKVSRQQSCWIWTLLALVGDFGTLDHERVSRIRDLGLSAGRLMRRLCTDQAKSTRNVPEDGDTRSDAPDFNTRNEEVSTKEEGYTPSCVSDEKDVVSHSALPKSDDVVLAQDTVTEEADDSGAEMIISEDEEQTKGVLDDGGLEEARARLLAQLGDRLVHSQMPVPDTPPTQTFHHLSRAEAERQRQEIRRGVNLCDMTPGKSTPASGPPKARSQAMTPLTESEWNTKVAIDMILTVVAECYGQKDLLEFRAAW